MQKAMAAAIIVLTALVVWPIVGHAPWEHSATDAKTVAACQAALSLRNDLLLKNEMPTKDSTYGAWLWNEIDQNCN